MSVTLKIFRRIHRLDNRLANQIAAGEVVERPASVVKELLENSIDSGATRIELEIERGGTRLIRITDNGIGIHKDDLSLALTRHATSKINSTEDLAAIETLGFRGEALASISSVSRLTLTSRPHDEPLAWQAIAQGRDMAVEVLPASAAAGTRIEVADLFYNTPARQKFLRTEKTEFNHVEEVFKQHALVNPGIAFILKHNHKVIKRVPAVVEAEQQIKRIADICGKTFSENALKLNCEHEIMSVSGWVGRPEYHRSESDIQYVFVNGRPVKDKTLNHAIRQSYEGLLPPGRMATYVIFISMDPATVDVNVHPTKHEVRFDQQRFVHDLLAKSVTERLHAANENLALFEKRVSMNARVEPFSDSKKTTVELPQESFSKPVAEETVQRPYFTKSEIRPATYSSRTVSQVARESMTSSAELKQVEEFAPGQYKTDDKQRADFDLDSSLTAIVFEIENGVWIGQRLSQSRINRTVIFREADLFQHFVKLATIGQLVPKRKPLLFPVQLKLDESLIEDYQVHEFLERIGFVFRPATDSALSILKVPNWMSHLGNETIFNYLKQWLDRLVADKVEQVISTTQLDDIFDSLKSVDLKTALVKSMFGECSKFDSATKGSEVIFKEVSSVFFDELFDK